MTVRYIKATLPDGESFVSAISMTDDELNNHPEFGVGKWTVVQAPSNDLEYPFWDTIQNNWVSLRFPKFDKVNNKWFDNDTRSYKEKREEAYPPIEDQMDMQYKDFLNGTTTWADMVSKIKRKYPKT